MIANVEVIEVEGYVVGRCRRGIELKADCWKKLLLESRATMWFGIHICLLVNGGTCYGDDFVAAELFVEP